MQRCIPWLYHEYVLLVSLIKNSCLHSKRKDKMMTPKRLNASHLLSLGSWPNNQTLLAQHLRFAYQAKCLTVLPHPKETLLLHHFLFAWSKHHATNFVTFAVKQCFWTWPIGKTCVVKQIEYVGPTLFNRWIIVGQTFSDSLYNKCLTLWPHQKHLLP